MNSILEKLTDQEILLIELFLIRSMIVDKKFTISQVLDAIQQYRLKEKLK